MSKILGIDVGATGIKGAIVDTKKGEMITDRFKLATPNKSTPKHVLKVMQKIIKHFDWEGKDVGIGFPSIINYGYTLSAANIHNKWLNFPAEKYFRKKLDARIQLINDADAAGISERYHGAAKDVKGTVILLTLGTGIGSAIFRNGLLIPNTELGHLHYKESIAEHYAANSVRERNDLKYKEWSVELQNVLLYIEHLFSPDLFILGGGVSKKFHKYEKYLKKVRAKIVAAKMRNEAGIIGAAMALDMD
ncbi:polyphosphate--glucose phosphotransferase [Portibacter marinus]|uniref:polyphosphate--glucose phosphotransferase n=1 Tax=Portibacter marinus TaxID=2898660 RepID=UPI001F1E7100|nr:ROK family protein [Portibacter marinus]